MRALRTPSPDRALDAVCNWLAQRKCFPTLVMCSCLAAALMAGLLETPK